MKIAVYAIALNESLHAERWAKATEGADYRIVADTGSTDGTQDILRANGVTVHQIYVKPWRFEMARNASLALLPDDVDACLFLDLDEVTEPDFFDKVRKKWKSDTHAGWVTFDTGSPWQKDKLHSRWGWSWKYPCHEVVIWYGEGQPNYINIPEANIWHKPDDGKSRGQYLDLLELGKREYPNDARNWTYLTREYYFKSRWQDVIDSATRTLELDGWNVEQAAVCRWAGESAHQLGQDAKEWYDKGVQILPTEGEPWYGVAVDAYRRKDWSRCLDASINAMERPRSVHYCYESAVWDWKAFDLAAVSAYNLGHVEQALTFATEALKANGPEQERIQRNVDFMEKVLSERPSTRNKSSKVGKQRKV